MTTNDYLLIVLNGLTDHPDYLADHFYREYKQLKGYKPEEFISNLNKVCKLFRQKIEWQVAERANYMISPKPKRETEPLHLGELTNFQFERQIYLSDIEKIERAIFATRDRLGEAYLVEEKEYRAKMYEAEFNEYQLTNILGREEDFIREKIAEQNKRIETYEKEILEGETQFRNQLRGAIEYRDLLNEKQKEIALRPAKQEKKGYYQIPYDELNSIRQVLITEKFLTEDRGANSKLKPMIATLLPELEHYYSINNRSEILKQLASALKLTQTETKYYKVSSSKPQLKKYEQIAKEIISAISELRKSQ